MTSNVGSQLILEYAGADERSYEQMRERVLEALRQHFRPEFLNRVDEIVVFHALTEAAAAPDRRHPARGLAQAAGRAAHHPGGHRGGRGLAGARGYDPVYGARPLKRVIQREVETPLARLIVAGQVRDGDTVRVDVAGDALRVEAVAGAPREAVPA